MESRQPHITFPKIAFPKFHSTGCSKNPPTMYSGGVWEKTSFAEVLQHPLPLLQLILLTIFVLQFILHLILKPLKLSPVVTQTLAGVILGVVVGRKEDLNSRIWTTEILEVVYTLGTLGIILYMFLIGVKIDPGIMIKCGRMAWILGIAPILLLQLICYYIEFHFRHPHIPGEQRKWSSYTHTMHREAMVSFPVIVCLLEDLNIVNTELGRLAASCSLISQMLSILLHTINVTKIIVRVYGVLLAIKAVLVFGFCLVVALLLFRPAILFLVNHTPKGSPVNDVCVNMIIGLAILAALCGEYSAYSFKVLPILFGLLVPDGPPLGSQLEKVLHLYVSGKFVPLYMALAGYSISPEKLDFTHSFFENTIRASIEAFWFKMVTIILIGCYFNMPLRDGAALGLILCTKGFYDIFLAMSDEENPIRRTTHIFFILLVATIIPYGVRLLYDPSRKYTGYQKRSLLQSESSNTDLKVLACIHKHDDCFAIIELLDALGHTKERPLVAYVLHLLDLVGRATPLLINHNFDHHTSRHSSRSQHILHIFKHYQCVNLETCYVEMLTAISPRKLMHEDICSVAFNKVVPFVILPFHKRWSKKGKLISNDLLSRTINCHTLAMAPCSVGILIDRHASSAPSLSSLSMTPYRVVVLFMGGEDDMEALTIGQRMARRSMVVVNVLHFIPVEDDDPIYDDDAYTHDDSLGCNDNASAEKREEERSIDPEILKELVLDDSVLGPDVTYHLEPVKDGAATVSLILSLECQYDLAIVGRRHPSDSPVISGIAEWSDFPELGPLGDILASSDIQGALSALVVQK